MQTVHQIINAASQSMPELSDESVDLVVTSPPYPMIEMWDEVMIRQNPLIAEAMRKNPRDAFELMHCEMDKVWRECYHVLRKGGFMCVNIGDATRTFDGSFALFDNHSRISYSCIGLGYVGLPNIVWRKQSNAPNKFMGSGMLPCGAYVTLEHEWILFFRKGGKRVFASDLEKRQRQQSSYFWEERNVWFSDLWEVKGVKQKIDCSQSRLRSAAFPFEIPYRFINMFSQKGDTVLDPFLGMGTTTKAAVLLDRNSVGYDIDPTFCKMVRDSIETIDIAEYNGMLKKRVESHIGFVRDRRSQGKDFKHFNNILNIEVMTSQEKCICFDYLYEMRYDEGNRRFVVQYDTNPDMSFVPFS